MSSPASNLPAITSWPPDHYLTDALGRQPRRARYRGLPKTRLDHLYMACVLNLLRLEVYWTGTPLDRQRTSYLARLELALAA